jgi:opacity protein-like surface antigen
MRVLLAAVLLLAMPVPASAEIFAIPFAGIKFGGSTSIPDFDLAAGVKKFSWGGSMMRLDEGILGFEATFGYIPEYFDTENELVVKPGSFVIDLTGSAIIAAPPGMTGGGLRPYAALGAGIVHAQSSEIVNVLQVRRTMPVAIVGGGAYGLITNNVGVRFDYRYLRSFATPTADEESLGTVGRRISYSRFTFGLLLRL